MLRTSLLRRIASARLTFYFVLTYFSFLAVPSARAGFTIGGPIPGHNGYNYAPSVISSGDFQYFWWCGEGYASPFTGVPEDYIYYQYHRYSTGYWSPIYTALTPSSSSGVWDNQFTCDPSVVQGTFYDPGVGGPYSYAMYYGGTDQSNSTNGRIGVAFSNDGINWVKYWGNPIIYPQQYPTSTYGAGQPSAYNNNGVSNITLFHTDTSYGQNSWVRTSTDGINFSAPTQISNIGGLGFVDGDYGYDPNAALWYVTVPDSCLLYTSPSPRDLSTSRMPSSA